MCNCSSTIQDYFLIRSRPSGNAVRRNDMDTRYTALAIVLAVMAASGWAAAQQPAAGGTVGGCPTEPLAFHLCALDKAKKFNPPRTLSGKPNLPGHYRAPLAQSYSF